VNGESLESLSASTREALVGAGQPREFRPGEVVFHQGDPCDSLFLLRRGRVSVSMLTPAGDCVTVGLIAAPEAFGEVGLIRSDHRHTASVVALDEVHVLSVHASRFHDLRADHPELGDWLLRTLVHRLERMSALLEDALFLDARQRVARRLLDCRCSLGIGGSEPLPLTQDDLAAMAGVSRPTANRVLRRLQDQGSVRLGRRHIAVADIESLARAAR
jgi:CRP/FNR family cyclic AMP-dependent transcriptional regulator